MKKAQVFMWQKIWESIASNCFCNVIEGAELAKRRFLKMFFSNRALKLHMGSRPFRYRKKNAQNKKAITAPHPSFILYPIKIIAITANITRTIREMNSKEKAGSAPIPNNPIYSKNIITSAFLFVDKNILYQN